MGKINWGAKYKTIRLLCLFDKWIDRIIENTSARLPTFAAGDTVGYCLIPNKKHLCVDSFLLQRAGNLR